MEDENSYEEVESSKTTVRLASTYQAFEIPHHNESHTRSRCEAAERMLSITLNMHSLI